MIANSDIRPENIIKYGITGTGQINYLIERNDKTDMQGRIYESWDYLSTYFINLDKKTLSHSIIREKYSQQDEIDLLHNYNDGSDSDSYIEFQKWRTLSDWIADQILSGNTVLKSDYNSFREKL